MVLEGLLLFSAEALKGSGQQLLNFMGQFSETLTIISLDRRGVKLMTHVRHSRLSVILVHLDHIDSSAVEVGRNLLPPGGEVMPDGVSNVRAVGVGLGDQVVEVLRGLVSHCPLDLEEESESHPGRQLVLNPTSATPDEGAHAESADEQGPGAAGY